MSETKWQRSSLRHISQELTQAGHPVSHTTVERLLKEQHYSLKANEKRLTGPSHPERNQQFELLPTRRRPFWPPDGPSSVWTVRKRS